MGKKKALPLKVSKIPQLARTAMSKMSRGEERTEAERKAYNEYATAAYRKNKNNHRVRLNVFKSNARQRKKSWELDDEFAVWLFDRPCNYCGDQPSHGIDRFDSAKNYTVDNAVPCCKLCNLMKNRFSEEVFLMHVRKIAVFRFSE